MNRVYRISACAAAAASIIVASFGVTIVHAAQDAAVAPAPDGCRKEVWRVDVTPMGGNPKHIQLPRFKQRDVLICDDKAFAKIQQR